MAVGLVLPCTVWAQTEPTPTPVRAFRLFDAQRAPGLPQSTVMALHQDDSGLLWIATLDGLGVFDGTEIRSAEQSPDAPVYGSLYSLARRGDGGVWVGGASQVWSWDGETWRVYAAPGAASSLAEDGLGRLWRVDQSGGLWRFDPDRLDPVEASLSAGGASAGEATAGDATAGDATAGDATAGDATAAFLAAGPWTRVATPSWLGSAVSVQAPVRVGGEVRAEVDVRIGPKLWLAGQRGVGMLMGDSRFQPVAGASPSDQSITALLVASDGTVWVASAGGALHHTVAGGWRRVDVPGWDGGHIRALTEDRRGRIWAGGLAGGLAFGRVGEAWTTWNEAHGLRREGILALLADREGTLWISANGFGLAQWIGEAWSHRNVWSDEIRDARQPVFGITPASSGEDGGFNGGFYAAVFARGVWHWDGERLHEYGVDDGLTENVRSVYEPRPGELWVSGRFGIFEGSAPGHKFRKVAEVPSGFVYGVQQAPNGDHWAHTSAHGILIRRAAENEWRHFEEVNRDLPDRNVKAVYFRRSESGTNETWLGTLAGLVVVRDGQMQAVPLDAATALPHAVQAIHEDPNGDVWVAGFGGVSRVPRGDLTAPIETLTRADGLPSHTIYSLASTGTSSSDPGSDPELWMGGSDGLGRLRLMDPARTIQSYDASDGLTEDECNHMGLYPAPDGSLYIGTMASLARFDPAVESVSRAPLHIEWLERPGADEELPARRRAVPLRWHAAWLAPDLVEYRTRIPRLGEDWSKPSTRARLDLENLGPGTWQVEVSARLAGREGGWAGPVATTFHIEPYFRETTGFYLLCVVLLTALVFAIVRWRTARLRRRARELQAAVDEALARIKILGGLIPICAGCKKVRGDEGYWQQIESYLHVHSEAELSHGLCPDCASEMYGAYLEPEKEAADEAAREADGVLR